MARSMMLTNYIADITVTKEATATVMAGVPQPTSIPSTSKLFKSINSFALL